MKKIILSVAILTTSLSFAQTLFSPDAKVFPTANPSTGFVGIGMEKPKAILDINANGSIPIIRGNGGYIPAGLRFIDDSYTQPGQIKEWSIWKGNEWAKGLAFMRYDASPNPCAGGICDVPLFLHDNGNVGIGTSDPKAALDVQGRILMGDGIPVSGVALRTHDTYWSRGYNFLDATGTQNMGGFAAVGPQNSIDFFYIGKEYSNNTVRFYPADNKSVFYGDVGIGTDSPHAKLDVNGTVRFQNLSSATSNTNYLTVDTNGNVQTQNGVIGNNVLYNVATNAPAAANTDDIYVMGKVGIGSQHPDEKLTVKGKIHAEEVRVDLQIPADYVFEKYYTGKSTLKADYTMPTLVEIEKFTKENNHLPNIPSAQEIKEKGLQVGEMTNLLLQKIEELTLYTIEQQKRIEALEAKIEEK